MHELISTWKETKCLRGMIPWALPHRPNFHLWRKRHTMYFPLSLQSSVRNPLWFVWPHLNSAVNEYLTALFRELALNTLASCSGGAWLRSAIIPLCQLLLRSSFMEVVHPFRLEDKLHIWRFPFPFHVASYGPSLRIWPALYCISVCQNNVWLAVLGDFNVCIKLERADYTTVQVWCRNLSGNELTRNLSGNIWPLSPQLAEPLWTDPCINSGISVRELVYTS